MSLIVDAGYKQHLDRYLKLLEIKARVLTLTQHIMDEGTVLYNDLTDATEKAEVLALKNALVAELRVILGV
jgi:hypothetical protein